MVDTSGGGRIVALELGSAGPLWAVAPAPCGRRRVPMRARPSTAATGGDRYFLEGPVYEHALERSDRLFKKTLLDDLSGRVKRSGSSLEVDLHGFDLRRTPNPRIGR